MAKTKRLSIHLTLVFFVVSLLLSMAFVATSFYSEKEILEKNIEEKLHNLSDLRAEALEDFLDEQKNIFYETFDEELFAKLLTLSPEDDEYDKVFQLVQAKLESSSAITVGITRPPGILVADKDKSMIGRDFSSSPGVQRSLKGERDLLPSILPGHGSSTLLLGQGRAVFDENGVVVGAAGMQLPLDELKKIVGNENTLGETAESYIVDSDLLLLTPSRFLRGKNRGVLTQAVDTENMRNCLDMIEGGMHMGHDEIVHALDYRGEEIVGIHNAFPKLGWCLLVEIDKIEAIDIPLKLILIKNIFNALIFLITFTLVGLFIGLSLDRRH